MPALHSQPPLSRVTLTPEMLPSAETEIFRDSAFFHNGQGSSFPAPNLVRNRAMKSSTYRPNRPPPVGFPELALIVKFGTEITIAEGQCLWAIRRLLPSVPVPEVYGWCRDGNQVFIYMQRVQGTTLEKRWNGLSVLEKGEVGLQLKEIVGCLGQFQLPSGVQFIGMRVSKNMIHFFLKLTPRTIGQIGRQPLQDVIFANSCNDPTATFPGVAAFHDWFTTLGTPEHAKDSPHPMRHWLPDGAAISFTHGDLHQSNIIVSTEGDGSVSIRAIVDWHQSGWLPSYWEYCKARWTASIGKDWEEDYLPMFLERYGYYEYEHWHYFVLRLGE